MKKIFFICYFVFSSSYSIEVLCCPEGVIEDKLPSYSKSVKLLEGGKSLSITFKGYTPLSWYDDVSKPKSIIIKVGNSYKFEKDIEDDRIGYSIEYHFIKVCEDKIIIKEETHINSDISRNIKYYSINSG